MKKLKIHYLTLILCICVNLALCQQKKEYKSLTSSFQNETVVVTQNQIDSCLKVNQAYQTTKGLLKVSENEKEVYKNQARYFIVKADSMSIVNDTLSIKLKTEKVENKVLKKQNKSLTVQIWVDRVIFVANILIKIL